MNKNSDNDAIVARIKGVPAQWGNAIIDSDPNNPNNKNGQILERSRFWRPAKLYFDHVNYAFVGEEPYAGEGGDKIVLGFTLAARDMSLEEFDNCKEGLYEAIWQAKQLGPNHPDLNRFGIETKGNKA